VVGPAHYGPGIYAHGTDSSGGLGFRGRDLLKEMEYLDIILDVTHLCDMSFREAMETFHGHVWASHNNCRALVPHNRQLSDDQIRLLIERDAVIGIPLDAWMMVPGWQRGVSTPESENITLEIMIDHIDHICQLAGNSDHVGIGTDLDGAFGREQCPEDIDTIADLQKLPSLLKKRGYQEADIDRILSRNFIDFLTRAWS
jgi:membrane dipeptidase